MTPELTRTTQRQKRPVWLLTFADLVALLLAFFVMLFATIEVELTRWSALIESLSQSLNPDHSVDLKRPSAAQNVRRLSQRRAINLAYLEGILREMVESEPALKSVVLHRREDRLIIALPSDKLFAPGSAVPVPSSRPTFQTLGLFLQRIGNGIDVFGHTDPTPANRSVFASNWGLSVARAIAVANELRRSGYHRELPALGYADTKFRELPDTVSLARRYSMARRVDIVVLPTKAEDR